MEKKKSVIKSLVLVFLITILSVILIVGCYLAYVFLSFHRLGDMELTPEQNAKTEVIDTGAVYKILSFNIGFGAYEDDYGFFMDGGTESWAWSEERLDKNLKAIAEFIKSEEPDLYLIQEVDFDSTRSYHFDEREYLRDVGYSTVFAQNYDSPFLMYPILQPHGISKAGIMTFSSIRIESGSRVEVPIEAGVMKLIDLDRCYSKCKIETDKDNYLVLYNFHLSAYTSDGTIASDQLKKLISDMESEYSLGNFCIAGGDFNKDILGDSSNYFGKADIEYTWAQPIPDEILNNTQMTLVAPLDESNPVPSCRNADGPYKKGQFVVTIDGFLVSPNVEVLSSMVYDTGFKYSDHNPVNMIFTLK